MNCHIAWCGHPLDANQQCPYHLFETRAFAIATAVSSAYGMIVLRILEQYKEESKTTNKFKMTKKYRALIDSVAQRRKRSRR